MPQSPDESRRPTDSAATSSPTDMRGAIRGPTGPSPPGPWEPHDRIAGHLREIELQLWTIQMLRQVPDGDLQAAWRQLEGLRALLGGMTQALPPR